MISILLPQTPNYNVITFFCTIKLCLTKEIVNSLRVNAILNALVPLPGDGAWHSLYKRWDTWRTFKSCLWAGTLPHVVFSVFLQLSEGTATQQTLHGLQPFTTYSIGVEACTCFNCCSKGPTAELRTHPAPPSGLSSPQIQMLSSRTASFQWSPPLLPNGVIQR